MIQMLTRSFNSLRVQVMKTFDKRSRQYHGSGGVNNLNDVIQEIMNPPKAKSKFLDVRNEVLRIGDRISQLRVSMA